MGWNDHVMGPGYEHLREDDNNGAYDNYDTLYVQRGADEAFRIAADDARKLRADNRLLSERDKEACKIIMAVVGNSLLNDPIFERLLARARAFYENPSICRSALKAVEGKA